MKNVQGFLKIEPTRVGYASDGKFKASRFGGGEMYVAVSEITAILPRVYGSQSSIVLRDGTVADVWESPDEVVEAIGRRYA